MFILAIATIMSVGLMIGTEFAVWAFINPILEKLDEPARAHAVRLFGAKLGKVMPFWYSGNFALQVSEAVLLRGSALRLLGIASGIWAAVIVQSLVFLVPINNRLVSESTRLSQDESHRQHQRWDAMHRVRVVALSAAFVLLLIGLRG